MRCQLRKQAEEPGHNITGGKTFGFATGCIVWNKEGVLRIFEIMSVFTKYSIRVDCLLSWFPTKDAARLRGTKTRMYTFSHDNEEPGLSPLKSVVHIHGNYLGGTDDGLESRNLVGASSDVRVNPDQDFALELEVFLGRERRKHRLVVQADTITPFLINVRATQGEEDQELADTAVAFQGVVTATARFGVANLIRRVFP